MRILWLKSDLLLPLDKGGRLRTWHLLRHLAPRHDLTYLSFSSPLDREDAVAGMQEVARRVDTVPRREPRKGSLGFYLHAARYLADPVPYAVAAYRSRAYRERLAAMLREHTFDVVVCDFLVPAINLPAILPCPLVLFTHNVEAEIWRRHAETKQSASRWLYQMQHQRMLRFEGQTLARADGILAVSDSDRETLRRLYPAARQKPVWVIPTGVDTTYFTPAPPSSREPHLVFTGSMDWLPNEDAMRFFCRDILPLIRAHEPGVKVSIVGRAPTPTVRALADDASITVTGTVDDVRPFVRNAAVYIVPLRIGGGTRLKIFEAMAMAKAVVSTTIGAEGLPLVDGEHAVIANSPQDFADAVVGLLRDPLRRQQLEAASRRFVMEHHDWSAVGGYLETALADCAALRPFPRLVRRGSLPADSERSAPDDDDIEMKGRRQASA